MAKRYLRKSNHVSVAERVPLTWTVVYNCSDPLPSKCELGGGRVYVLELSDGFVKIGRSEDVAQRVQTLIRLFSGYGARVVTRIAYSCQVADAEDVEYTLLSMFKDRSAKNTSGITGASELFSMSFDDVISARVMCEPWTKEYAEFLSNRAEGLFRCMKTLATGRLSSMCQSNMSPAGNSSDAVSVVQPNLPQIVGDNKKDVCDSGCAVYGHSEEVPQSGYPPKYVEFQQLFDGVSFRIERFAEDQSIWFSVKDVCAYFGETHPQRAAKVIDDGSKRYLTVSTPGGPQSLLFVDEPGLYQTQQTLVQL